MRVEIRSFVAWGTAVWLAFAMFLSGAIYPYYSLYGVVVPVAVTLWVQGNLLAAIGAAVAWHCFVVKHWEKVLDNGDIYLNTNHIHQSKNPLRLEVERLQGIIKGYKEDLERCQIDIRDVLVLDGYGEVVPLNGKLLANVSQSYHSPDQSVRHIHVAHEDRLYHLALTTYRIPEGVEITPEDIQHHEFDSGFGDPILVSTVPKLLSPKERKRIESAVANPTESQMQRITDALKGAGYEVYPISMELPPPPPLPEGPDEPAVGDAGDAEKTEEKDPIPAHPPFSRTQFEEPTPHIHTTGLYAGHDEDVQASWSEQYRAADRALRVQRALRGKTLRLSTPKKGVK